ncbi:MAG TPA: hypothetical protein VGE67_00700, partial [Haloferula sp.]
EPANQRRRISKLEVAISALLAVGIVAVIAAVFMGHSPAVDRTFAIGSLKQMNLALIDFDSDYGRFPDAATITDVKAATHTTIPLGDGTSNELFRQLVAAGNKSEKIFWAPSPGHRRKPNDILGTDALAKGECIHSYVAGLSTKDDPGAIIAMAPMISGTIRFDPVPYGNKAVVLRVDGSAKPESLDGTGHINIYGKDPLDPSQPHWHGKAPDLKWPE